MLDYAGNRFVMRTLRAHPKFAAQIAAGTDPNMTGTTKNGLNFYRYIDTTAQVRRMSVSLILIVEQSHIQDVLMAFASSRDLLTAKYRGGRLASATQPTQMHWQHMPDTYRDEDFLPDAEKARALAGRGGVAFPAGAPFAPPGAGFPPPGGLATPQFPATTGLPHGHAERARASGNAGRICP